MHKCLGNIAAVLPDGSKTREARFNLTDAAHLSKTTPAACFYYVATGHMSQIGRTELWKHDRKLQQIFRKDICALKRCSLMSCHDVHKAVRFYLSIWMLSVRPDQQGAGKVASFVNYPSRKHHLKKKTELIVAIKPKPDLTAKTLKNKAVLIYILNI